MITPELEAFVRQQLQAGNTTEAIAEVLSKQGWTSVDITSVFERITGESNISARPENLIPVPPEQIQQPSTPLVNITPPPILFSFKEPQIFETKSPTIVSRAPSKMTHVFALFGALAILAALGGGAVYAYTQGYFMNREAPYNSENLLSGILEKTEQIDTVSYSIAGSLETEARDEGAEPFSIKSANQEEERAKYQNDVERMRDINVIRNNLRLVGAPFPETLDALESAVKVKNKYRAGFSRTDPVTGSLYRYIVSNDKKSYMLSVTFETDIAVNSAKTFNKSWGDQDHSAESFQISGKTVMFIDKNAGSIYLPSEQPKPYLVELGDMARFLPAELSASIAISADVDWSKENSDWMFNVDATGDFGDLTYKVNVDMLRKEPDYYLRINNLPSLFMSSLPIAKGDWLRISPDAASSTKQNSYQRNILSSYATSLAESEKKYKEARKHLVDFVKAGTKIADKNSLIKFKDEPKVEDVNGSKLYKYNLQLSKEAILPFYTELAKEAQKYDSIRSSDLFNDTGLIEYLKSSEFSEVFDYVMQNTTLTLWVDMKGYPAKLEYSMRLVPPDTAVQLANKQVRYTVSFNMDDINEPIVIEIPKDAKSVEETIKLMNANNRNSPAGVSMVKSNMNNLRAQAELVYDSEGSSYGKTPFPLGPCTPKPGTLFGNSTFSNSINAITYDQPTTATCYASKTEYALSAPLPGTDGFSWCIDSTGMSKQIKGSVTKKLCAASAVPKSTSTNKVMSGEFKDCFSKDEIAFIQSSGGTLMEGAKVCPQ